MKIDGKVKGQNILYRADCKEAIQRLIEKEVLVDLIYLDPPFNSNRKYSVFYKSKGGVSAQQRAFDDTWNYTKQTQDMLEGFQEYLNKKNVAKEVKIFLEAMLKSLGQLPKHNSLLAYLIYMAERLVLCHKILKDTGSIYYHCDPTASHYIKIIMDGIFGNENFRNEIVWDYKKISNSKGKKFNRRHDVILFYSKKESNLFFENQYTKVSDRKKELIKTGYNTKNMNGVKYIYIYDEHVVKSKNIDLSQYDEIKYVDPERGTLQSDVFNVDFLNPKSAEYQGYHTQKPVDLLDIIIKACCPSKGVVLDPFCGCGTTVASAFGLKRKFIGIDISIVAIDIIKDRLGSGIEYREFDGNPETRDEYDSFTPFQKQDFLISRIGGIPNSVHTGDGGVDGSLKICLGDKEGKDKWGDLIFSVKTGKQSNPEMIRELIGTVKDKNADMGIMILEADPSDTMELLASRQGKIKVEFSTYPALEYDKIQIFTASELITMSGQEIKNIRPHSISEIRAFRRMPTLQ